MGLLPHTRGAGGTNLRAFGGLRRCSQTPPLYDAYQQEVVEWVRELGLDSAVRHTLSELVGRS